MSEDLLVKYGSPTLAGIKTGSLFACVFENEQELKNCVRSWNRAIVKKGLRALPLRKQKGRALIYVYRLSRLKRDLCQEGAKELLTQRGYCWDCPGACLKRLIGLLDQGGDFPHEIGLFLGYPPEDVKGFIQNAARGFQCAGCWKVYGDQAAAMRLFEKYKRCTKAFCARYAMGFSIDRLTVAG